MQAAHWDAVYADRGERGVSWFAETPALSLELFDAAHVGPGQSVIDVGRGRVSAGRRAAGSPISICATAATPASDPASVHVRVRPPLRFTGARDDRSSDGSGAGVLHLRVITPPADTDAVRKLLLAEPGATHITVLPGVAVQPEGDVVEADVTRESVDAVLETLRELGIDRSGGVTLETIDTTLSNAADAAEEAAPGDPSDAVIWEEVVARTGEESRFSISFQAFLTIACLLAAIGAITDSSVTVVGAMVLGPEFGPLAAVAVGLALRRGDLIKRGAFAVGVGFPLAMAVTALASVLFDATGLLSTSALDDLHQVDFIYEVGPFSFIVALLAGGAGMLSLTSAKSASLVGVFISVTTVPAAAFASVALVEGRYAQALGSVVQLGVNVIGIVVAAVAVLLISRRTTTPGHITRRLSSG